MIFFVCFCLAFWFVVVDARGPDGTRGRLTSEAVQGAALALECVHDVKGRDGLPAGVLRVGDGVADDVLQEHLQDASGLLVDEARNALDTTSACETADGGLGDALDVVTEDLAVALGSALAQTLASLSTARHDCFVLLFWFSCCVVVVI